MNATSQPKAPKEYMCGYGNCMETKVSIIVTIDGSRNRYCSLDHAAAHLLEKAKRAYLPERSPEVTIAAGNYLIEVDKQQHRIDVANGVVKP